MTNNKPATTQSLKLTFNFIRRSILIGTKKKAFTLVELSIVLIVISLLISVVIVGVQIVRGSELKSVIAKVNDMKNAISQFKSTYQKLPGDIGNATSFWPGVENGNNNGMIEDQPGNEAFSVLTHLQKAGFIHGNYSGKWSDGFVLRENTLPLEVKSGALYVRCCSKNDYDRDLNFNNHIVVFAISDKKQERTGVLTPVEAFEIDKKIDDGNPDSGFVGAIGKYEAGYTPKPCYKGRGSEAIYESANKEYKDLESCQLLFALDW